VAVTQEMPLLPIPVSEFAPVFVASFKNWKRRHACFEVG
jgi:hypothetical protein